MELLALPAFADNYIWMLHDAKQALVVDPGDARVVFDALSQRSLQLHSILVTHHHADHTGGVDELREATSARVLGPASERIPQPFAPLREGDQPEAMGITWQVIDVPGHTAGHIAYYAEDAPGGPLLFCGDTLFSAGCGRLFEGTPAQMSASLAKLEALPAHTRVCCTHEYTLANLRFARAVEPGNAELRAYEAHCMQLRERGEPTLPSTLERERQINPFLRCHLPEIVHAAQSHQSDAQDRVSVFAALREWKNNFR
jgi:hydroxyacylglutathione hydrolase